MAEEILDAAEQAAKNAKRAAMLAVLAVVIAAAVLAIDNGIKRAILEEAGKARRILDEFKTLASVQNAVSASVLEEVRAGGTEAAGEDGAGAGGAVDSGDGVVHAAGAPAAPGGDAANGVVPARDPSGRFAARPRGHE